LLNEEPITALKFIQLSVGSAWRQVTEAFGDSPGMEELDGAVNLRATMCQRSEQQLRDLPRPTREGSLWRDLSLPMSAGLVH